MQLSINLLKQKRSVFRMIFGIIAIIFSISWIIIQYGENDKIKIFDWFYFLLFFLLGICHLIESTGISLRKIFGAKAYIHINNDKISIKPYAFYKEKNFKWTEIKEIEYKSAQYKITKTDNTSIIMELSTENYHIVQNIKESINSFATEKGIQIK
jgi:hypothetical protein